MPVKHVREFFSVNLIVFFFFFKHAQKSFEKSRKIQKGK